MNLLLVDMGNTRIKFTCCDATGEPGKVSYALTVNDLVQPWQNLPSPDSIWVCSVASEQANRSLIELCKQLWQRQPEFIQSSASAYGVHSGYAEPERLGVDRWLAMIAAYHIANKAVLVVDAGSALTIDAVDSKGQHLGGWFVAGTKLSCQSLVDAANFRVNLSTEQIDRGTVFGTSSEQGMLKGAVRAAAALVDQAYMELAKIEPDPLCYLTGGDAVLIQDALQCPYTYVEDLVLKGLALFARDH